MKETEKIRKIYELINLAEVNIKVCVYLYESKINEQEPRKHDFARLIANNCFNSCVSILHTLLISSNDRELRISSVAKGGKYFQAISDEFRESNLDKIRHQSIGHKNELLKYPAGSSFLLKKKKYINKAEIITNDVKKKFCEKFNYSPSNQSLVILDQFESLFKV